MKNLNLNFIQLEQGIRDLITQSQLPITVVDSILKNISYEIAEQKQNYLIQLKQQMTEIALEKEDNKEIEE